MEQRSRPFSRLAASEKETSDWMPSECFACGTMVSSSGRLVIVTVLLPMAGASCEYGGVRVCEIGVVLREQFGEGFDCDIDVLFFEDVRRKETEERCHWCG